MSSNSLNLGIKAGWWPPDQISAEEYLRYAADTDKQASLDQFDAVVGQAKAEAPNNRAGASSIFDLIMKKINSGTSGSLIRLGDADGNVMFSELQKYPNLGSYCLRKISRIYFGSEKIMVEDHEFFLREVVESIKTADIVGAPERATIARSFETDLDALDVRGMVGMRGVYNYLSQQKHLTELVSNAIWTSTWISRSLLPYFPKLFKDRNFVGLITCYDDLGEKIKSAHGVQEIGAYIVPMQASIAKKNSDIGHYPEVFRKTIDSISVPFPGALFIVAAGILSKPYCRKIKSLGGVAIDVGSSADVWMGVRSRPGMTSELVDQWQL